MLLAMANPLAHATPKISRHTHAYVLSLIALLCMNATKLPLLSGKIDVIDNLLKVVKTVPPTPAQRQKLFDQG